jgi:hypothetical protein
MLHREFIELPLENPGQGSYIICISFMGRTSTTPLNPCLSTIQIISIVLPIQWRIQGGGAAPGARPPKIGKNMIFWSKIVIFHTKYPKNFPASLRSAQFF